MDRTCASPIDIILAGRAATGCEKSGCLLFEERQSQDSGDGDFLCAMIAGRICGINIMRIREIIKPQPVTEIPGAPAFVSGIFTLRGDIIPVLDTRRRLGLEPSSSDGGERVVVVRGGAGLTGLIVDRIIRVARLSGGSIQLGPIAFPEIGGEFVSGMGYLDECSVILLNVERVADIPPW